MTKEEIYRKTKHILVTYLRLDDEEIQPDTHIIKDLGADSLALVEIGFQLSETFGIPVVEAQGMDEIFIIKGLIEHINEQMQYVPRHAVKTNYHNLLFHEIFTRENIECISVSSNRSSIDRSKVACFNDQTIDPCSSETSRLL